MEKQITIRTSDNKVIYGTLCGSITNPLIIFVHGLGGFKDEHIFFNGARYLEKRGYSTLRFDLYNYEKDARKLQDCTLSIHAQDLDTVIRYLRNKGLKTIHVVGHSFGGPTILLSKQKEFDKVVLWDPSIDPEVLKKELKHIEESDAYYVDWGAAVIIGKKMIEENKAIKPLQLIKNIHVPIKLIFAGKGELKESDWKKYFDSANQPKAMTVIPSASHNFHEEGTEEQLFEETLDWLKKFS